jgi:hypothetical protein
MKIDLPRKSVQWEPSFSTRKDRLTGRQTWAIIVAFRNIVKAPKNGGWEIWTLVISLRGAVVYFNVLNDVTEDISNRIILPDQLLDTAPP